ncbi:glucuronate isomerase [Roseobacter sp.]|uniref:glucuronate isomerase n=1 Tax=Roseobacter sp. TaxID=1907202 RepID=UPI0032990D3F
MQDFTGQAGALYEGIRDLPIVSPHGHCDPAWFATDAPFANPASLLVVPDHYVFRMLYSQGVSLADLGVGVPGQGADPRAVFRLFAAHWHLFLGTPSRFWISYVLAQTLGIDTPLSAQTADAIYEQIADKLAQPAFRPRALFDQFGIEVLATTDGALDDLAHHQTIAASDWPGRVIPTFRPDGVLDPSDPEFLVNITHLGAITGEDIGTFDGYLTALRARRAMFKACGATATDHAIEVVHTQWLDAPDDVFQRVQQGTATPADAAAFYGHMLIEMAQMSVEDGLVMQIHGGSRRNTNAAVMAQYGRDKGADIPIAVDWVRGLDALLNRVGNTPGLTIILFTLDETTYARELAPMAGHWPCLRIGPPWWFHDSTAGIARYFDQVVETAGYHNLAGFNDDTRAFLSIPARHDMWRRGVALHLEQQVTRGVFDMTDARELAPLLATDLARGAYKVAT